MSKDFLQMQYQADESMSIRHSYLVEQFSDNAEILRDIQKLVQDGDYTLGKWVSQFETSFAKLIGCEYAVGVGSGTDALRLSLLSLDLDPGTGILTSPFSFVATTGAIVTAGMRPVFIDVGPDLNVDCTLIDYSVAREVGAALPVHWAGRPADVTAIKKRLPGVPIVEDACHAVLGKKNGVPAGAMGDFGCFSFHPLKNLNVWGDGGIVTTNKPEHASKLRKLGNHGLTNRDVCSEFAFNSRLDSLQAIVASHMLIKISSITNARRANAAYLDECLRGLNGIRLLPRRRDEYEVFHLYQIFAENRDRLLSHLRKKGVDAKVHYPTPLHLQPAARYLGHGKGDFPMAEAAAKSLISLPVHEFVSKFQLDQIVVHIRQFYE